MTATSAINPLRVALFTALEALPIIGGPTSPKVFHAVAPRDTSLPFIVVDAETEDETGALYQQGGQVQTAQIKCWGTDSWEAQDVYAAAKAAVHGVSLPVTGYQNIRGVMERLTGFLDQGVPPDESGPYCVVGRLSTRTMIP